MLLRQLKPQETRVKRRKEGVGELEEGARESVLSDDPQDSKYFSFLKITGFLLDTILMYLIYHIFPCMAIVYSYTFFC